MTKGVKQKSHNIEILDQTTIPAHDATIAETIKYNYQLSDKDAIFLRNLKSLMKKNADAFAKEFYDFIFNFEHAKAFLKNDEIIEHHNVKIKEWFLQLFSGNYDETYFSGLSLISEAHSRIGLSTHYINASFNFVRRFILKLLVTHNLLDGLDVIEKIVDINLDVLTSAYLQEDTKRMIKTIKRIKKALNTSAMVPFYQPIVNNIDGAVVKYECLVRIIEQDGTIISPFDFLSIAKQVKLYPDITREVIQHAFENHKQLNMPFSINLSIEDIETREINDLIFNLLKHNKIGNQLTFEILESEQIKNYEVMKEFIRKVKAYGVKIAIDDFGSGFSNFDHITKMEVDFLKIDGSLIKELHVNKESRMAVEAIVGLADKLEVDTVAEFVCSQEVYEAVKKAGINYSQGFYFGKPEPLCHYI